MGCSVRRYDHQGQEGGHLHFATIVELNSAVKEVAVSREVGGRPNPAAGVSSVTIPFSSQQRPRFVALVALQGENGLQTSSTLRSRQVSIEAAIGADNDPAARIAWPGAKPRDGRRFHRAPL